LIFRFTIWSIEDHVLTPACIGNRSFDKLIRKLIKAIDDDELLYSEHPKICSLLIERLERLGYSASIKKDLRGGDALTFIDLIMSLE